MRRFLPSLALLTTVLTVTVASSSAAAQRILADLTGKWRVTVSLPDRTSQSTIDWKQTGDSLSGAIELEGGMGSRAVTGALKSDTVRFEFSIDMQGQSLAIRGVGVVRDKDTVEGTLAFGDMNGLPFAAKRQP